MTTVAVIGAGVTGLTTAYELLDRGFEVTVFDRHRYAAMETSFANGGQLSASNAETWTQWGTVLKGLKWMLQADAPLLVNPAPDAAQDALDGRVPVEHPALQGATPSRPCASPSPPARCSSRWRRARASTSTSSGAASCTSTRPAEGPRARPHGQRPARRGRARAARALAGRDPRGRAGAARRLRRRLPDRERQLGRHPQVHHRAWPAPAPGAAPTCASAPRSTAWRRSTAGCGSSRTAREEALRRRGGLGRRPQPGDRRRRSATGSTSIRSRATRSPSTSTTPRARRRRPGSACSTTGRRSWRAASARTASASPAPPSSTAPTATSAPTASGRWSSGARSTSPACRPSTRRPGPGSGR